jgi:hypothetical protein
MWAFEEGLLAPEALQEQHQTSVTVLLFSFFLRVHFGHPAGGASPRQRCVWGGKGEPEEFNHAELTSVELAERLALSYQFSSMLPSAQQVSHDLPIKVLPCALWALFLFFCLCFGVCLEIAGPSGCLERSFTAYVGACRPL